MFLFFGNRVYTSFFLGSQNYTNLRGALMTDLKIKMLPLCLWMKVIYFIWFCVETRILSTTKKDTERFDQSLFLWLLKPFLFLHSYSFYLFDLSRNPLYYNEDFCLNILHFPTYCLQIIRKLSLLKAFELFHMSSLLRWSVTNSKKNSCLRTGLSWF